MSKRLDKFVKENGCCAYALATGLQNGEIEAPSWLQSSSDTEKMNITDERDTDPAECYVLSYDDKCSDCETAE